MEIMILCKVVDNYGDIGFVYRLSRNILELLPSAKLNIIVSNLTSFASMAPFVKPDLPKQTAGGFTIYDWNDESICFDEFSKNTPELILECFQCGRPEWLDQILFDPEQKKTVRIINIEYLSAETWADDFHLLKSGTRSTLVKKVNFMPGFTKKTGSLVLDKAFMLSKQSKAFAIKTLAENLSPKAEEDSVIKALEDNHTFCLTIFSYPRTFNHLVGALKAFAEEKRKSDALFKVHAFVAPGLCAKPFLSAFEQEGAPFGFTPLPYLKQEAWDALLCACDFNFVRGEDSFARACLCAKPFVWHAYEQDEELHLVKVQALLERLKPFVEDKALFLTIQEYFLLYNKRFCREEFEAEASAEQKGKDLLLKILQNYEAVKKAMVAFSASLIQNGNLTEHLLNYIQSQGLL